MGGGVAGRFGVGIVRRVSDVWAAAASSVIASLLQTLPGGSG